jgi:hypothetical protein
VRSFGSYAYAALAETHSDGSRVWNALASIDGSHPPDLKELAKSLVIPQEFLARVRSVITPGTTLIITHQPVNRATRSNPGFRILTSANA